MQKVFASLLLIIFGITNGSAQYKNSITVIGKPKKDGMWIRWAPTNPTVWQMGNKYGYIVERFTLLSNGELESQAGEKLTPAAIKPYTRAEIDQLSKTVKEADVLLELIYDETMSKPFKANDPSNVLARNQDIENKYGVALLVCDLSPEVAKAAALFFKDQKAVIGKRYIYRVSLAQQPAGSKIEPGVLVMDATDEKPLMPLKDLKAEFRDKTVSLSWSTITHTGVYSSYYIEKSEDGKTFKKVSELPYVHMSTSLETETAFFVDSLEVNGKTYHYRISGISPFGETGPPSNVVSGEGKDNLSGYLVIREGKIITDRQVRIVWEFPVEAQNMIAGFHIKRANKAGGPYTDVTTAPLTKETREFIDITSFYNTYYQVTAIDKSGNEVSRSFPFLVQIEDNTPPANPSGLIGNITKTGLVELKWQANKDADLMGYRVFRSNSLQEEFVEVTQTLVTKTVYTDTIMVKVLNRKIFYRVVAVDKNYNNSEFSEILTLDKPDIVPPIAPVFTKTEIENGTIVLKWVNSTSRDISKVELTRLEKEDKINRVIKSWAPGLVETEHKELSLTPGKTYQYKVIAYDSAGNASEGISPQIYYETGFRNSVSEIQTTVDRDGRLIKFQWKNAAPATKCTIYRRKNDEPLMLYKTLEGNINTFTDKNIAVNNQYTYKIQVTYSKGIKSLLSEEIKVVY